MTFVYSYAIMAPVSLTLALLFHFNQHISEHARLASLACYRGLLRVLRARPQIKANLHLSGTLLHALQWLDPEPLELVRDGLADGQFELLGSTYAQNVLYASDDWDNARQIELHLQVLHDFFGITPTVFWNVERCWRQSLLPIIASAGYRTVLVEDHILNASGAPGARVYRTRLGGHVLQVVRDDERLKHYLNFAAWFGRTGGLHVYLDAVVREGGQFLAYAEDAEAMGLWGYWQDVRPEGTWERLGQTLDELAARSDQRTGLLAESPEPAAEASPIRDGSARWMDASLARPGLPYHEAGYRDWFDFNARSPKLARYRRMYAPIRERLKASLEEPAPGHGARALCSMALHTYLAHQYEFGCIGIGEGDFRGWDGAHAALALARASELAGEPQPGIWIEDINADGQPEALLSDGRLMLVTTPLGGRLLYWFDLVTGRLVIGNPLAVVAGEYRGDAFLPPTVRCPQLWLPGGEPDPPAFYQIESPPTRMGKYLPDWIWEAEPGQLSLAVRQMRLPGERLCLAAQRRGLVDTLCLAGEAPLDPGAHLSMRIEEGERAVFERDLGRGLSLEKSYRLDENGVVVAYRFYNPGSQRQRLALSVSNELCLDYAALLRYGRRALAFTQDPGMPGVLNPITGERLSLQASHPWKSVTNREALLALEVGLEFEIEIDPGQTETLDLGMSLED